MARRICAEFASLALRELRAAIHENHAVLPGQRQRVFDRAGRRRRR